MTDINTDWSKVNKKNSSGYRQTDTLDGKVQIKYTIHTDGPKLTPDRRVQIQGNLVLSTDLIT